ncbi:hypothetical protein OG439_08115 [Amycolatopsis sp. NBC_01307]|uniref:hypothetical protein n=1 Tax=Amycolatopsis sp. NBC_01307 TaxID=2903561 RepID=UPI002E13E237|nr:hypothetical protein OG439_08115 [Amycolatopsis sp. NBC_01307]
MALDVHYEWRKTTEYDVGFTVVAPEIHLGEVPFDEDCVVFCFTPRLFTARLRCWAKVVYTDDKEPFNNTASVVLEEDGDERKYIAFSSFGWADEQCRVPIGRCKYEVWLEGSGSVTVQLFV